MLGPAVFLLLIEFSRTSVHNGFSAPTSSLAAMPSALNTGLLKRAAMAAARAGVSAPCSWKDIGVDDARQHLKKIIIRIDDHGGGAGAGFGFLREVRCQRGRNKARRLFAKDEAYHVGTGCKRRIQARGVGDAANFHKTVHEKVLSEGRQNLPVLSGRTGCRRF